MSNKTWEEIYSPKNISEIVGNVQIINTVKQWLVDFERKKKEINIKKRNLKREKKKGIKKKEGKKKKSLDKSSLLVTGSHGTGKTTIINVILKDLGYDVMTINPSTINNKNKIFNPFNKLINPQTILNLMDKKNNKNQSIKIKKALVIDEIEAITSSTHKKNILAAVKQNEIDYNLPMIFISNNKHNKLLSDIKKISLTVPIYNLYSNEMKQILLKISNGENIEFEKNNVIEYESLLQSIVDHSQYDVRRMIHTIMDLKYTFGNNKINKKKIIQYFKSSKKKNCDLNLYNATDMLLYKYKSIDECIKYYETEKVLLPLMMHQNYPSYLCYNVKDTDERITLSRKISEVLSFGDVIENDIYGNQNWDLQDIHGYYTCALPSYFCNQKRMDKLKKNEDNDDDDDDDEEDEEDDEITKINLVFPWDLNKTSIQCINKKNISNAKKKLSKMDTMDFINVNKIVKKLLEENNIEECIRLLKPYGTAKEHIESLLKIDKMNDNRCSLTSKQKKKITLLLSK